MIVLGYQVFLAIPEIMIGYGSSVYDMFEIQQ